MMESISWNSLESIRERPLVSLPYAVAVQFFSSPLTLSLNVKTNVPSYGYRTVHNKVISGFQTLRQASTPPGGARARNLKVPSDFGPGLLSTVPSTTNKYSMPRGG
ncbi:hypothetical protein PoB_000237500 [Plakobranchus ocellatus]|uniref:Uncharacterized protein n=1 Tax=Plakobranchus ocellatus TaxID=259542 RepID=A0AAV3XZ04_9GAST|nr:hypothetical protein PoB_000237500 [Plakobranchus ocellatus]